MFLVARRIIAPFAFSTLFLLLLVQLLSVGRAGAGDVGSENLLLAATRYVATTGSDTSNDCSTSGSPCATIQHAVDEVSPEEEFRAGSGAYQINT